MRTTPLRALLVTLLCSTLMLTVWSLQPIPLRAAKPAATFGIITVTTANDFYGDDGHCSLREAIEAANTNTPVWECAGGADGLDTILFNLGAGTPVINVTLGALPDITEPLVIDGASGGATRVELNGAEAGADASGLIVDGGGVTVKSLVINRFDGIGIYLRSSGNAVQNCYIGTNAAGTTALGNLYDGITIEGADNTTIGGTSAGQGNVISGNGGYGVGMTGSSNNLLQGNLIGTNAAGTGALGNSMDGVQLDSSDAPSTGNTIGGTAAGAGNTIAFNSGKGVSLSDNATLNNRSAANRIYGNGLLGLDLNNNGLTANDAGDADTGPNNLQNFPVLTSVSATGTIRGSLDSTAGNSAYPVRLEFFANTACDSGGNGEGEAYLGFTTLSAPGNFSASVTLVAGKNFITATATDNNGNTSEFSACRAVNSAPTITASAPPARQQASPGFNSQIATVSDAEQAAATLVVLANDETLFTVNGVTISNIAINASGQVTADFVASCTATNATFTLRVLDSLNDSSTAALTVNVTANSAPVLGYNAQTVAAGAALTVNPISGPSDNGAVSSIALLSQGAYTGTISINNSTGVVSISNPAPGGVHSITIRATDNCGAFTDATFALTVECPTIYLGPADLLSGTMTAPYNETITANGGTGPYTFNIARTGNPPPWLSLSPSGLLSGTPTSAGAFTFIIRAVDALGCEGLRAYTLLVNCVTFTPTSHDFDETGGAGTISLSAPGGCTWTAVSNAAWITVTGGSSGTGNGTVSYTVAANTGNAPRTGTITIGSNLFAVEQDAPGVELNEDLGNGIPPGWTVVDAGVGGGNAATWTTANPCSQTFPSLIDGSFLSVDVSCSGPGSVQDEYLVLPPLDLSGAGRVILRFDTQFSLDLGPTHTGDVDVSVNGGTLWNNVLRLQTVDGAPLTRSVDLTNAIAANPTNVLLRFHYYGQLPNRPTHNNGSNRPTGGTKVIWPIDNVTIQSFAISPVSVNVLTAGGTGSVNVMAADGVAWTAHSNVNWITALSSGGTGSGTAAYRVDANTTGAPRTGTLTIAENTFTVNQAGCVALVFSPATLNNGTAGTLYSQPLNINGGTSPYSFSILNGALPNGVSLTASGALAGTPAQTGTFNFTAGAQDANGCTGNQPYTLTVNCPVITVNPATLNAGTAGMAFSQTFAQSGGSGTIVWSHTGTLPTGLPLNAATGALSGTPTATGTFSFTIIATDANNCTGSRAYTLALGCPTITVNPSVLAAGTAGAAYSQAFTQSGGSGTIAWSHMGTLPTGLTLNAATGALSGTPTATGNFNFTIIAADANNCSGSRAYALTINCPVVTLAPAALSNGTVDANYNQAVTASPAGAYSFAVTAGSLPGGITLNSATGALSGTPTAAGTANFTLTATGFGACVGSQAYALTINCPAITINPATLPSGSEGAPYNQALAQTGATGALAWSISAGALPNGLSLNAASGVLSGATLAAGTFNFTVRVAGGNGCFGEQAYALMVANCPVLTLAPQVLPNVRLGRAFSQALTGSGGQTPYTISLSAGALPAGVTLAANGLLAGTPVQSGTFAFTVLVRDAYNCSGMLSYTLVVERGLVHADFDGDGRADVSVWRPEAGAWYSLDSSNGAARGQAWGAGYAPYNDVIVPGDYDGDGKTDYAVWRGQDAFWYIRQSSNGQFLRRAWGANYAPYNDVPVPGDYDGDGKTDLAVWRPADGTWYVLKSSDGGYLSEAWGTLGDIPVPGDYDGDGKADFAVWRPSDGGWYIKKSSGGTQSNRWGSGLAPYFDVPVPADYDGDGKTDCAVWRGGESNWYILQSSNSQQRAETWGADYAPYHDVPVPGDYDGDGKADIAVWRSSNGTWYVRQSSNGTVLVKAFGQAGDVPVPAYGVR